MEVIKDIKEKHGRRDYWVAESDGVGIREYKCSDRFSYNGGYVFEYKNDKSVKELVLVPRKYRYGESDGRLIIGKNRGNSSAAIMVGVGDFMVGNSIDVDAPGEDCSLLYRTHMMASGYKTLYEKSMPWKWLIVGIAVLVVVVGVVWFVRSQGV